MDYSKIVKDIEPIVQEGAEGFPPYLYRETTLHLINSTISYIKDNQIVNAIIALSLIINREKDTVEERSRVIRKMGIPDLDGVPITHILESTINCLIAGEYILAYFGLSYVLYQDRIEKTNRAERKLKLVYSHGNDIIEPNLEKKESMCQQTNPQQVQPPWKPQIVETKNSSSNSCLSIENSSRTTSPNFIQSILSLFFK